MRRRIGTVLVAFAFAFSLSGCVPSDPAPSGPVAIQAADGARAEILYLACRSVAATGPTGVTGVSVLDPTHPPEFKESDPPVWKISFVSPVTLTDFVVGDTPAGATVDVPLATALSPDKLYMAVVSLGDHRYHYEAFKLAEMGDRVAYDNRYMSRGEFARASACPSP